MAYSGTLCSTVLKVKMPARKGLMFCIHQQGGGGIAQCPLNTRLRMKLGAALHWFQSDHLFTRWGAYNFLLPILRPVEDPGGDSFGLDNPTLCTSHHCIKPPTIMLSWQHSFPFFQVTSLWPPYVIGGGALYFCPVVSFYLLSSSSFFSSPNLSGHRAARCKCRTQKSRKKSPSGHHPTTLSGYIFATKACIDNRKKTC